MTSSASAAVRAERERVLSFQGGCNFRDIGGYRTQHGSTTRWGKVYRAGVLTYFTSDDHAPLTNLQVRAICDLRRAEEREREPTRWPDATTHALSWDDGVVTPTMRGLAAERPTNRGRHVRRDGRALSRPARVDGQPHRRHVRRHRQGQRAAGYSLRRRQRSHWCCRRRAAAFTGRAGRNGDRGLPAHQHARATSKNSFAHAIRRSSASPTTTLHCCRCQKTCGEYCSAPTPRFCKRRSSRSMESSAASTRTSPRPSAQ